MTAATLPFAGANPFLVEIKPVDGPGDYRGGDVFVRRPVVANGIVEAQTRERRVTIETVDMRYAFAGAAGVGSNRRVDHDHADVRIDQ